MTLSTKTAGLVALGLLCFLAGRCTAPAPGAHENGTASEETTAQTEKPSLWICPMHPTIQLPEAGDCPLCGMDLVPQAQDTGEDPRHLSMSAAAVELAGVVTAPVERSHLTRPVRLVGKVAFDETLVKSISAWVPGRLDRLFVDFTGLRVRLGDHLVKLYSPELFSAQEELLSARGRLTETAGEASEFLAASNRRAFAAAREKLILMGLTEDQVQAILKRGAAQDHVIMTSPAAGVVIEKLVEEGSYVQTGTVIYKIADLDHLWVRLDAYEKDLAWLRYGQEVAIEAEALPGQLIEGRISFIDDIINEHTRTAMVRVNVDNRDGQLKPGMFVRAVAAARVGAEGRLIDTYLAGKWVSPMHPEIVKDGPGACDVCGMDLVPAEELGLVAGVGESSAAPLVLPASAVLLTGKRAVVYIQVPGAQRPTFEGREVRLGPRAGDRYIVLEGVEEGEEIVVQGAFRIDSSMQIRAKPSMMGVPGETPRLTAPVARWFLKSLENLYATYGDLHRALSGDRLEVGLLALGEFPGALSHVRGEGLPDAAKQTWRAARLDLESGLREARAAEDIEVVRAAFEAISRGMLVLEREFGHTGSEQRFEAYCPMAFDDTGASWLQVGDGILNPYFGSSMLTCGELREEFQPSAPSGDDAEAAPEEPSSKGAEDEHAGHDHDAASGGDQ